MYLRACMAIIAATAAMSVSVTSIAAEPLLNRTIKIVVPSAPGGFTDIAARAIVPALSARTGQSVVIENRGGAGGLIGTVAVMQSAPDGFTLIMGNNNTHAMNVGLYQKLPYDPVRDFAPIAFIGSAPTVLVVHPGSPHRNVSDLIAAIKAQPGKLTYGSGGVGASSHLAGELLAQRAGLELIHVPFKGNSPATQAILGDQLSLMFDTLPSAQPLVQAGRLRALAVTGDQRVPVFPDVPTMAETLPGFEVTAWIALFAPVATPRPVIEALDRELTAVVTDPAVKTRLAELGATTQLRRPAELAKFVAAEITKWNEVIRRANIPAQP